MAVSRQEGRQSMLLLYTQPDYNTYANAWAQFIPRRFPFTRFTLDQTGEQIQSESIVALDSDTLNILSRLGADGDLEMEVLPDDLPYILRGAFNPDMTPTSTALAAEDLMMTTAIPSGTMHSFSSTNFIAARVPTGANYAQASWPGQVVVTVGGTPTLGTNPTITFNGQRRTGRSETGIFLEPVSVTRPFPASGTVTSPTFMHRVYTIVLNNVSTGTSGTVAAQFVSGGYDTEIRLNSDAELFTGWTMAGREGLAPFTALSVIPREFELNIGQNFRALARLIALKYLENRIPTDLINEALTMPNPAAGMTPTQYFPVSDTQDFFGPRGAVIQVGTDDTAPVLPVRNLRLRMNRNLEEDDSLTGDLNSTEQPTTGGRGVLEVTLEAELYSQHGTAVTDVFTRWNQLYRDSATQRIRISAYRFRSDGRGYRLTIQAGQAQLTESSRLAIETPGTLPRRVNWKIVPTVGATSPDELVATVRHATEYDETR